MFRSKNATDTFKPALDVILAPVKLRTIFVYLDHFVVFSNMPEELIIKVKQKVTLLRKAVVILKFKKHNLFANTINYCRDVIRLRRLEIAPHTTDAMKQKKNRVI